MECSTSRISFTATVHVRRTTGQSVAYSPFVRHKEIAGQSEASSPELDAVCGVTLPRGLEYRAEADKIPQGWSRFALAGQSRLHEHSVPKLNAVDRASPSARAFSSPAILRRGEHLEYHPIPSCPHGPRQSTGILVFLCSQPTSLVRVLRKAV